MRLCFAILTRHGNTARDIMNVRNAILTLLTATAMLGGCADAIGRYPSLALREFETRRLAAPVEPPPAPAAPSPNSADSAPIAAIRAAAETAFTSFTAQQASAASVISRARGQSVESDAGSRALAVLADLSTLRSVTFVQLGDLDLLAADRAVLYESTDEIDAARSDVAAMIHQQDRVLANFRAEIGQ